MRNHTCLLDHHQRSHYVTITIELEGMMNWVLQLNNQPVGKLVQQSFGEAPRVKLSKPTQSKPKPICDRSGKPEDTERVLVVKRPVPTRSMKKVFTENLFLQIDRGNLIICLKTPVLSKPTMDQGNLMSETAQVHTQ